MLNDETFTTYGTRTAQADARLQNPRCIVFYKHFTFVCSLHMALDN